MKFMIYILIGLMMIGTASALVVSKEQYITYSNQQIKNYMQNNFDMVRTQLDSENLYVIYNLVKVEEMPDNYNSSNEIDEYGKIRVETVQYVTSMPRYIIEYCLDNYSTQTCINKLIYGESSFKAEIEGKNVNVVPTYLQAMNKGIKWYKQAIALKDRIIADAGLSEFVGGI